MDALWSDMRSTDWIVLGLIALVPALMVIATYLIRNEVRRVARQGAAGPVRSKAPPLRLKTTEAQRHQWRMGKQRHPRTIVDLTDDVETLLKRVNAGDRV
jgi:hypothetical protein